MASTDGQISGVRSCAAFWPEQTGALWQGKRADWSIFAPSVRLELLKHCFAVYLSFTSPPRLDTSRIDARLWGDTSLSLGGLWESLRRNGRISRQAAEEARLWETEESSGELCNFCYRCFLFSITVTQALNTMKKSKHASFPALRTVCQSVVCAHLSIYPKYL